MYKVKILCILVSVRLAAWDGASCSSSQDIGQGSKRSA